MRRPRHAGLDRWHHYVPMLQDPTTLCFRIHKDWPRLQNLRWYWINGYEVWRPHELREAPDA